MALDRFVYWPLTAGPSQSELTLLLEDYFGAAAEGIATEGSRLVVTMRGRTSGALRRVAHAPEAMRVIAQYETDQNEPRTIEVFMHHHCIDVITRHADEFTNAVAHGFAALCARVWVGHLEEG